MIWVILALLKPIERGFIQQRNRRPRVIAHLGGGSALAAVEGLRSVTYGLPGEAPSPPA
ncbi:MAG: hypothetical protein ABIQ36_12305 [Rhodanobacter sp.]